MLKSLIVKKSSDWMKQIHFIGMVAAIVLISGCITPEQPKNPFIKEIKTTPDYVYQNYNQNSRLDFMISNPLQITFTGYTEVKIDMPNCITTSFSQKKDIIVPAKSDMPFSVDLLPSSTDIKCIGSRQITLVLNDVNKIILDYKTVQLNIVQKV